MYRNFYWEIVYFYGLDINFSEGVLNSWFWDLIGVVLELLWVMIGLSFNNVIMI